MKQRVWCMACAPRDAKVDPLKGVDPGAGRKSVRDKGDEAIGESGPPITMKPPSRSQLHALEDTARCGNPYARVLGQSAHGGMSGTMAVLQRNRWIVFNTETRLWEVTPAGRAVITRSRA